MKKTALRIYRWIIISFILQLVILLFFNNVYLARRGNVSKIEMTDINKSDKDKKSVEVTIPENVTNIKVSYDSSYVSYIKDAALEIMDVKKKTVVKTLYNEKGPIVYYDWLQDRNMVVYSFETPATQSAQVKVSTYDVDNEIDHDYDPTITRNLTKGSKADEVVFSTKTNVVYVKAKTGESQAKVYRYNIMDELSYINTIDATTNIEIAHLTDNLIYNDLNNDVNVRNGVTGAVSTINFDTRVAVIGVDFEDNVYVGKLNDNNKVTEVLYGKYDTKPSEAWKSMKLHKPVPISDIVLTKEENIYSVEREDLCLYNIKTGDKITYKGNFVQIKDSYVATLEGNKLKLNVIK